MIIEQTILPFEQWFLESIRPWAISMGLLIAVVLVVGFIAAVMKYGILHSFRYCVSGIGQSFANFFLLSPKRTWAIAKLTIKESLRRRVLFVCVVFLIILMFAGWYLDPNNPDPAKLYISFVTTATCYLMLLLAMFLSAFSLPTDFKTKTIFTVVTKPVRPSEMVLGRIVGITLVGTAILLFMAFLSYFFVQFSLEHSHLLIQKEDLTEMSVVAGGNADDPNRVVLRGAVQQANGHRHEVEIRANGTYVVQTVNGHSHDIEIERPDGKKNTDPEFETKTFEFDPEAKNRFTVFPSEGVMQARVPVYGNLIFRGKDGMDTNAGIDVGHEWNYRSFIGGTGGSVYSSENKNQEAAFWEFQGITEANFPEAGFPDGIPVEMTLGVYRTHKGDMEKGISANIAVRNPKTGLYVDVITFSTEEFITKAIYIPRTISGTFSEITQRRTRDQRTGANIETPDYVEARNNAVLAGKQEYDLFKDLCDDEGRMEIWLSCGDSQQYIGVAPRDLYVRAADANVPLNFVKGFFGIWQQMLLMICYGVALSTFLSGPVSMVGTLGIMIAGFFKSLLINIAFLQQLGGGPVEAFVRIITQQNLVQDLPEGFATSFIKSLDWVYAKFLVLIGQMIPPLSDFHIYYTALASGFDIPANWLLQNALLTCAYVLPLYIIGYLILGNREVAK